MNNFGAPRGIKSLKRDQLNDILIMELYGRTNITDSTKNEITGQYRTKNDVIKAIKKIRKIKIQEKKEKQRRQEEAIEEIQRRQEEAERAKRVFSLSTLLEVLPEAGTSSLNAPTIYRQPPEEYEHRSHRLPAGSRVIRKEPSGLTNKQKSELRKGIKDEIDRLSELLKNFN